LTNLMKVKNKKLKNLEKENAKKAPMEKYEVETWCGEFVSGIEKKPKRCRRKLARKSRMLIRQERSKLKRRHSHRDVAATNDDLETDLEEEKLPLCGHIGIGKVKNISDEEIPESVIAFLSLGPKFCPTPSEIDIYQLKKDLWEAERR
jgi:hypothetical protein